jgi:membrane associated rhomboid family serine protease
MNSVVRNLILANIAAFVAQQVFGDALILKFALWPLGEYHFDGVPGSVGFQPWQLITCAFLHGGIAHIALNMYGLWAFGQNVERALGPWRFLALYFASVLTSGLVQLAYVSMTAGSEVVPTIGASGGVFGVLLAFGMLFPHVRVMLLFPPIPMKAWLMVIVFGLIELLTGVTGTMQGIAHFAHLGGMLGALVIMLTWTKRPSASPGKS